MKHMPEFARRLRELMEKHELSQEDLANLLDVSQPSISNYVRGRIPPAEILLEMSRIFRVSMEYLLTGTGSKQTHAAEEYSVQEPGMSYGDPEQMVISLFRGLTPEEKKAILLIMKKLANRKKG
jgi:transcriptional regulator with XRE-family HTH domain